MSASDWPVLSPGPRSRLGLQWSPAEDRAVWEHYRTTTGRTRLAKMLPHRTRQAIAQRAMRLGVPRTHRHWTAREDRILRIEWGELQHRTLREKLPGRAWKAIVRRAYELRLPSAQQGHVTLAEAARRTGFCVVKLREILDAEGVRIEHFHGGPLAPTRECPRYSVDPDDAEEAVRRHLAREAADPHESLAEGAARVGLHPENLRARLRTLGIRPVVGGGHGYTRRFRREDIDRAAAVQRMGRSPGGLAKACADAGIVYSRALYYVQKHGLQGARGVELSPDVIARVVAALAPNAGPGVARCGAEQREERAA